MRRRRRLWMLVGATAALGAVIGIRVLTPASTDAVVPHPPTLTQLRAVASQRIFFAHQSVGANILDGLRGIARTSGVDLRIEEGDSSPPAHVPSPGGVLVHTLIGTNGDPYSKLAAFSAALRGPLGGEVDTAILKFCYLDVTADTDVAALVEAYTSTIAELQAERPDVRFVYATVPLTTDRSWKAGLLSFFGVDDHAGPRDNHARAVYNDFIRTRFASTGALFDVAAVEATLGARPAVRSDVGGDYAVLNAALAADNGHLNALGAHEAAAELVRVLADPPAPDQP